jgi:predicted ATPase
MSGQLLKTLKLTNFLSFGPDSEEVQLTPLNVLIGPNASGKSNFIEAIELLHAMPTDFSDPIRIGGTAAEWLWKGAVPPKPAELNARLGATTSIPELRYRLAFTEANNRVEVVDEVLEETTPRRPDEGDVFFYYRYQHGHPVMNVRQIVKDEEALRDYFQRKLRRQSLNPEQSVLSQRKDPDLYPELTRVAGEFGRIKIFREWGFGRSAGLRQPQPANLPSDTLLPTIVNLGLVLNDLEHRDSWPRFLDYMQRFLPRFSRLTTKIQGGAVQIYLWEDGLKTPVPATRLADGTIRFLALLAVLLNPEAVPLLCIEEPELGLHPDALAIIAELLVEASGQTQVVVTTHSDVLVSALTEETDSVLVTEYVGGGTELGRPDFDGGQEFFAQPGYVGGGTEFRRLDSVKLKHWLEKYRLGEIWRMGKLGGNL